MCDSEHTRAVGQPAWAWSGSVGACARAAADCSACWMIVRLPKRRLREDTGVSGLGDLGVVCIVVVPALLHQQPCFTFYRRSHCSKGALARPKSFACRQGVRGWQRGTRLLQVLGSLDCFRRDRITGVSGVGGKGVN
jgi:hypothetical protein